MKTLALLALALLLSSNASLAQASQSPLKVPAQPTTITSVDIFTQSMFGHLGLVEITCGPSFSGLETSYICGETTMGFDRFKENWDLYADWTTKVPIVPTPFTAWKREDSFYVRSYTVDDQIFSVFYADGLVLIGHREH